MAKTIFTGFDIKGTEPNDSERRQIYKILAEFAVGDVVVDKNDKSINKMKALLKLAMKYDIIDSDTKMYKAINLRISRAKLASEVSKKGKSIADAAKKKIESMMKKAKDGAKSTLKAAKRKL